VAQTRVAMSSPGSPKPSRDETSSSKSGEGSNSAAAPQRQQRAQNNQGQVSFILFIAQEHRTASCFCVCLGDDASPEEATAALILVVRLWEIWR
jgi:hypothetical protein